MIEKLMQIHNLQFLAVCEPRLEADSAERYWSKLKFSTLLHNTIGSIWLFFQDPFSGYVIGESPQHVSIRLPMPTSHGTKW